MRSTNTLLGLLTAATPALSTCPSVNGTITLDIFQVYPENADWDPVNCKLYIGSMFNSSLAIYDPYTATSQIVTFPSISGSSEYHLSGVDYSAATSSMYLCATAANPFVTSGQNLTGPNHIIRYDTSTNAVAWTNDLADVQASIEASTGVFPGGVQDTAEDADGNIYVPFSYGPKAIAKVDPETGDASVWFASNETAPANATSTSRIIYNGLVWHPSGKLIVTDNQLGTFVTFATNATTGSPTVVTIADMPSDYTAINCDGLTMPALYGEDVLLCSEDGINAITVFASTDGWASAKYLGQVANDAEIAASLGFPTATVQVAESLYIVEEWFTDGVEYDTKGSRTSFPLVDITASVSALVAAAGF